MHCLWAHIWLIAMYLWEVSSNVFLTSLLIPRKLLSWRFRAVVHKSEALMISWHPFSTTRTPEYIHQRKSLFPYVYNFFTFSYERNLFSETPILSLLHGCILFTDFRKDYMPRLYPHKSPENVSIGLWLLSKLYTNIIGKCSIFVKFYPILV